MTKEELMLLVKAGFTAEEIRAMSPTEPAEATPEPEEIPAAEAEPEAEPAEKEPEWKGAFEGLRQSLDSLTKQLQADNRATARIEETVNTVDNIIAGWINPGKGN